MQNPLKGLSDNQQFLLMLVAMLTELSAWIGLGAPTDKASLLAFGNSELLTIILAIKEKAGAKPTS